MLKNMQKCTFEVNLNFERSKKPAEAFNQIGNMYDQLIEVDRFILKSELKI